MSLNSSNQTSLFGFNDEFKELVSLYVSNKLPNKILLSGQKGIGKCTIAYHFINYVLSANEDFTYDLQNFKINNNNKSFKLVQNKSNPNFTLIDLNYEKKYIDITQVRNMILNLSKTSLNSKPRFVLIDNIEYLNSNSINALLKILEEPNDKIFFILINSNKKILPTLISRCLNFKISITHKEVIQISNKLVDKNISEMINNDLLDYYMSPGKIYRLNKFSIENEVDLKKINLKNFLLLLINELYYKKDESIKNILYEFIELFLIKNVSLFRFDFFNYFLKRINDTKKFNLDEESLFIEFKSKLLNE